MYNVQWFNVNSTKRCVKWFYPLDSVAAAFSLCLGPKAIHQTRTSSATWRPCKPLLNATCNSEHAENIYPTLQIVI